MTVNIRHADDDDGDNDDGDNDDGDGWSWSCTFGGKGSLPLSVHDNDAFAWHFVSVQQSRPRISPPVILVVVGSTRAHVDVGVPVRSHAVAADFGAVGRRLMREEETCVEFIHRLGGDNTLLLLSCPLSRHSQGFSDCMQTGLARM